jgi:hypothetical protein
VLERILSLWGADSTDCGAVCATEVRRRVWIYISFLPDDEIGDIIWLIESNLEISKLDLKSSLKNRSDH